MFARTHTQHTRHHTQNNDAHSPNDPISNYLIAALRVLFSTADVWWLCVSVSWRLAILQGYLHNHAVVDGQATDGYYFIIVLVVVVGCSCCWLFLLLFCLVGGCCLSNYPLTSIDVTRLNLHTKTDLYAYI